ncbi:MAG: TldD/PmbA family protein [Myxococcales bacterium]|nr:TldD/PmbA family protein [Myxococcales bacterium]
MSDDELLDRLSRALARAGGDAELSFHGSRSGTTRFAGSRVTQTGDVIDKVVQARVADGRRVGAARVNAVDDATLDAALARARALAASLPASDFDGFDDGRAPLLPHAEAFDGATADVDAAARAALIAPAFDACARAGVTAAGLCAAGVTTLAVATTAGARRLHRYTRARFDLIASDANGKASGRRSRDARAFSLVAADHAALVDDVVARAVRSRDPAPLAPGEYDVVLEPHAVAELLEWLALTSFGARAVEDGSSALAGRRGETITGALTMYDDALGGEDGCPTAPFDAEGTPRRRVTFVDAGVAGEVVHDRSSAAQAGARSTGHAPPIGDDLFDGGPIPQHLMLAPGDATVDELIGRVERGLLVSRFHYVNGLLDTRRALMTGMTRDGLWRIENGRVAGPAANQRWTESFLDAGRRVDGAAGISRERQLIAGGLSECWFVCPTILVRGWKFSG